MLAPLLEMLDSNGDGVVNVKDVASIFRKLDKDSDNEINRATIGAFRNLCVESASLD